VFFHGLQLGKVFSILFFKSLQALDLLLAARFFLSFPGLAIVMNVVDALFEHSDFSFLVVDDVILLLEGATNVRIANHLESQVIDFFGIFFSFQGRLFDTNGTAPDLIASLL
jgi:hypothetical protein